MKKEHTIILEYLKSYLEKNPNQRFGQAVFNLGINEFQKTTNTREPNYNLRDIHNDNDEDIISRINNRLDWFDLQEKVNIGKSKINQIEGMTVNERLFASDLMEIFDEMKLKNKEYAHFILRSLKVDEESISKILK
jgi:hypothetical protein